MAIKNKVSIVIIGRNEESGISRCIDAAVAAADQIGGAEIIYVDSNSTDNSSEIARDRGAVVVQLSSRFRPSPSAGRFEGTQSAAGDYILFLDADTLIYKDFLPAALDIFNSDPTVAGINGNIDDISESGRSVLNMEERSEHQFDVKWLRGPACFYRREALVNAGSFDPRLAVEEEAELGLRLIQNGGRLVIIPRPMACHTRCYHGNSIESIYSTFKRDIRSKRLGETTKTISHAFLAGNGLAFCWLRLKTTILFVAWTILMVSSLFLPGYLHPYILSILALSLGALLILAKKKSLYETLLFIPSKILNIVDLAFGIHKIDLRGRRHDSFER